MRLIDADALIEAHYDYCCKHHGEADVFYAWSLQLMKNAPTIDAVEVVRCKDCRFFQDNQIDGYYPNPECRWGKDETPNKDDFCSYGVRITKKKMSDRNCFICVWHDGTCSAWECEYINRLDAVDAYRILKEQEEERNQEGEQ